MSKKIAAIGCALLLLTSTACSEAPDSPAPSLEASLITEPVEATDPMDVTDPVEVTESLTQPVMTDKPTTPKTAVPSATEPEVTHPETVPPATAPEEAETESAPATEPAQTQQAAVTQQSTQTSQAQQSASSDSGSYTGDPYWADFAALPGWDDLIWPGDPEYNQPDPDASERLAHLNVNTGKPELPFELTLVQRTLEVGQQWGVAFTYPGDPYTLTWTSSDPSVATVNYVGYVTPLAEGETLVSVSNGNLTLTCRIIVIPATPPAPVLTAEEKDAAARAVAKEIAEKILNDSSVQSDLDRIRLAAGYVFEYVREGRTSSYHEDCRTAYGTLVAGYSNCVGTTKATGLVLEYMGYTWRHVNKNEWCHQWCEVYNVDGQTAYCDSAFGEYGYGTHPDA